MGAAVYDNGLRVGLRSGVMHRIDPKIDAERDCLMEGLRRSGQVAGTRILPEALPIRTGKNALGDAYFTDGNVVLVVVQPPEAPPRLQDLPEDCAIEQVSAELLRILHTEPPARKPNGAYAIRAERAEGKP